MAVPSPIVETFTVPARPVSVPGANLVPSNFKTWLVVAPEGSICMPPTVKAVVIATEEGRERVYTPVVAFAATAI